ncbi:TipC family immunity protein [Streptococcus oralis]|uniref:TipC family immunity protein n=1 Tax=Streptococcus oralis TaxID=1303 RepID=UPI0022846F11|nr:TipC family immunity protein [Streptococcus oralis]MCY7075838.1 TipC family immunity protein [Streptococcus oralis]
MKKILGVLTIVVLLVSVCFYFFTHQPKNIFDEIYQETEKTYRTNNILRNIEGFEIDDVWPSDGDYFKYSPLGKYKTLPKDYLELRVGFNFEKAYSKMFVSVERKVADGMKLWMVNKYNPNTKTITKSIQIVISGNEDSYIEDEAQVKSYLEQYGITAKDLDSYYDEIINQKVLKDWCSIYDSKYSPTNYGEVKVETQWENW